MNQSIRPTEFLSPKICVLVDPIACSRRLLDGKTLLDTYLPERGAQVIGSERIEEADYAIIVTCGFNDTAVGSGLSLLKYAQTFLENTQIFVMGCLPGTAPEKLSKFNIASAAPKEYAKVDTILAQIGAIKTTGKPYQKLNTGSLNVVRQAAADVESTYYINVCSGCTGHCSYCAIRRAIGKIRSRSLCKIRSEIEKAIADGATGIYLGADDLGAWGVDCGQTFPELLRATIDACISNPDHDHCHLDLRNVINPIWIVKYSKELQVLFKEHADKIQTFSIALQSGSSTVLNNCGRYDNVTKTLVAVKSLHSANPNLYSFGHIIVGLPKEGKNELQETLKFMDEAPIQFWTIFKYSPPSRTASDNFDQPRINSNWKSFIDIVNKQGYKVCEAPGRAYVAKNLDHRYVWVNFEKASTTSEVEGKQ